MPLGGHICIKTGGWGLVALIGLLLQLLSLKQQSLKSNMNLDSCWGSDLLLAGFEQESDPVCVVVHGEVRQPEN